MNSEAPKPTPKVLALFNQAEKLTPAERGAFMELLIESNDVERQKTIERLRFSVSHLLASRAKLAQFADEQAEKNSRRSGKKRHVERDAEIVKLKREGKKVAAIASKIHISIDAVRKVLARNAKKVDKTDMSVDNSVLPMDKTDLSD